MNFLDRAITSIAPIYGVRRAAARAMLRAYDGAASGKRRVGFGVSKGGSANVGIGTDLATLRDRARNLTRNASHASTIVDVSVRHIVGTGITPIWNTGSDRLDKKVSLLWEEWIQSADVEGELDFYGQQALLVRAMVEGGESLLRFVDLRRAEGGRIPLRLQMLEGDHIDTSRDANFRTEQGRARLGVVLGNYNRRVGYYLFPEHPGENLASLSSNFVPREFVRHVYRPLRIGQVRGVSWLAPIIIPLKDLADLLQFTIVKTQVEASFAGFITNNAGLPSPLASQTTTENGERKMLPEPGSLYELKAGQDIKFPDLTSSGNFADVSLNILQSIAVGAGLTYDQVTGDLRQANYSSLRAGKIEHRRFVEQTQFHCVIPRICDPVADRFIDRAIIAGELLDRREGYPRDWVPPANEPIDPKKDLDADISAVRAGRMSPQEFITQWGRDWRKVVADTKVFWEAVDAANVKLDIDPRRPLAGAAAPAAPADNAAAAGDGEDLAGDPPTAGKTRARKRKSKGGA